MLRTVLTAALLSAPLLLASCGAANFVKPYRMEIQQGNFVTQEMVSQLRPGMTREQVRFVLGTPLVTDVFHADRWDYVFYRDIQGGRHENRRIAVLFEGGKLARVVGDVVPSGAANDAALAEPQVGTTPPQ